MKDEQIEKLAYSMKSIANAILPSNAAAGHDAVGGHVDSLTEAVMGMTGAMVQIANALDNIADAIREKN